MKSPISRMFAISCAAIALFASCANPANSSSSSGSGNTTPVPTVTLSVTNGSNETTTSIYSDEPTTIKATVANLPGTTLTYIWFIDGEKQDSLTTDTISGSALVSTQAAKKFSVTVSNGSASATGNVTITLVPAASFVIENNMTTGTVDSLFFSTSQTNGTSTILYSDIDNFTYTSFLKNKILPNTNVKIWNITPAVYYYRADKSNNYVSLGQARFTNGVRKTLKIYDTNSNLSNRKYPANAESLLEKALDESTVSEGYKNFVSSAK